VLDPNNEIDIAALHYIFMPRIQENLDNLVSCLQQRPLRTEGNRTPRQLWLEGQIRDGFSVDQVILGN